MSYQVLARKWRPQVFNDVIGQRHVLIALANGLSIGRIHHAYIFSGMHGVGKTSIARLLAKGLNCESGITANPCGLCDNCREIEQGCFIDLIEIDAASRTKVEDTRDLLDNLQYTPTCGRFKVYLIDEVHMLSHYSFNALLKSLEEPPEHIKFILATTDSQKLPMTILSRCLQFHLKAIDIELIRIKLEHILDAEHIVYDSRALQLLARAANGSMRDALSLTDQAIASGNGRLTTEIVSIMLGTIDDEQALLLIEAIVNANGEKILSLINEASLRGIEWEALLVEMLTILHRISILQLSPPTVSGDDMIAIEQRLRKLANIVLPTDVQFYYQTLLIGRKELPFAPNKRIGVEMTLLRTLTFNPSHTLILSEPEKPQHQSFYTSRPTNLMTTTTQTSIQMSSAISLKLKKSLPNITDNILDTCKQLYIARKWKKIKNTELIVAFNKTKVINNINIKRLDSVCKTTEDVKFKITIQKVSKKALEHKKTLCLFVRITKEVRALDYWLAEVNQFHLPKLVRQLTFDSCKEQKGDKIFLHLHSEDLYLNTPDVQKALIKALCKLQSTVIKLVIINDDNQSVRTPMDWYQASYKEKFTQERNKIITDNNIHTLYQLFNADMDENSIRST